ncbi:MAG: hypothetical protein KGM24_12605, partial [Elusimicrobia bacterium]|nr:hypothetical protein [Elusimicrobiota bacterium]
MRYAVLVAFLASFALPAFAAFNSDPAFCPVGSNCAKTSPCGDSDLPCRQANNLPNSHADATADNKNLNTDGLASGNGSKPGAVQKVALGLANGLVPAIANGMNAARGAAASGLATPRDAAAPAALRSPSLVFPSNTPGTSIYVKDLKALPPQVAADVKAGDKPAAVAAATEALARNPDDQDLRAFVEENKPPPEAGITRKTVAERAKELLAGLRGDAGAAPAGGAVEASAMGLPSLGAAGLPRAAGFTPQ